MWKDTKRVFKKVLARTEIKNPFREIFKGIEFETTAYCNRKCSYCPVSMYPRPGDEDNRYMRDEVFQKILNDLQEIKFSGLVAPHLYGEPLTDPRIIEWMGRVRRALPKSTIKLVTNGDYLTPEKYHALIEAGVDYFNISKHGQKLPPVLEQLMSSLEDNERKKRFFVTDFWADFNSKQQKLLNTRGGEVGVTTEKKYNPIMCSYVVYPVINTFGDVILCCNDYHNEHKFGNVMERNLKDIWLDPKNLDTRKRIYKGHFDLKICQNCYM